jgi:hypothetical protein
MFYDLTMVTGLIVCKYTNFIAKKERYLRSYLCYLYVV